MTRIHSLDALPRLLALTASHIAQLLNVSDLAAPFQKTIARRLNHDPSLEPSVVNERLRVLHQFELQNIDEETNRSLTVVNDESDEFQLRHLHVS